MSTLQEVCRCVTWRASRQGPHNGAIWGYLTSEIVAPIQIRSDARTPDPAPSVAYAGPFARAVPPLKLSGQNIGSEGVKVPVMLPLANIQASLFRELQ
ncbi:hypothetical protein CCHR01_07322 [Colletotrichum chrysophilum]|uniref:Uncharacterized protein n=1 Tax=Colletotrichum chrysophilum TaxID=1836956 RepID=A0AAD9AQQ8_9PEZI|nr:hypothetical protein CCHR01_07322 [Colletotrichum chrysophilum]